MHPFGVNSLDLCVRIRLNLLSSFNTKWQLVDGDFIRPPVGREGPLTDAGPSWVTLAVWLASSLLWGFPEAPSLWVLRQGWLPGYLAPCESSLAWDRGVCNSCSGWPGQQSCNTALWAPPQSILQSTAREEETSWLREGSGLTGSFSLPSLVLSPLCHRPTSQHVRLLLSEPLRFCFCLPSSDTSWPFGALTWVGMWGQTALLACLPFAERAAFFSLCLANFLLLPEALSPFPGVVMVMRKSQITQNGNIKIWEIYVYKK